MDEIIVARDEEGEEIQIGKPDRKGGGLAYLQSLEGEQLEIGKSKVQVVPTPIVVANTSADEEAPNDKIQKCEQPKSAP